ncbi:MAG: hypothetical protein AAGD38_01795 [Acidobacteriota bacterium]
MSGTILTTYFTSKPHPLYGDVVPPDSIDYITMWFDSMRAVGLGGVVFHDGLSDTFVATHQTETIRFVYRDPAHFRYSLNDHRFVLYRDYLVEHPEIERVFMTDGNDVAVKRNPFADLVEGLVYVGSQPGRMHPPEPESDSHESMSYSYLREQIATMGPGYDDLFERLETAWRCASYPVFNAGIVGGHRRTIIDLLNAMIDALETIDKPTEDLNMGILNYVIYRDYRERFVTNQPVHSVFGQYQNHRDDVWFVHK